MDHPALLAGGDAIDDPSVVQVGAPSWDELEALASRGDLGDRAFASSVARLRAGEGTGARARADQVLAAARRRALTEHAHLRAGIRAGTVRGPALRGAIEQVAAPLRDAWTEEVLDVAHPPLEEAALERELVSYTPSGVAEILHAIDTTGLRPGQELLDLGAGMGKVALLAALLTGARARGLEIDPRLVEAGRAAAIALGIDGIDLTVGDARLVSPGRPDVVFLYVPFTGDTLRGVLDRLEPGARARQAFVCAAPIDRVRHPWLVPVGASCSWMQVHRAR